jgi:peroxiredoxin
MAARARVVAIGPDGPEAFRRFWAEHNLPFVGIPDPDHRIADAFGQEVVWWRLGRMPSVCIVTPAGRVGWVHYGSSMADIVSTETLLAAIAEMREG